MLVDVAVNCPGAVPAPVTEIVAVWLLIVADDFFLPFPLPDVEVVAVTDIIALALPLVAGVNATLKAVPWLGANVSGKLRPLT